MTSCKQTVASLLFLLLCGTLSSTLYADAKPALLVLGSAHFNTPGQDNINVAVEDVLTAHRQIEIAALVDKLAEFKPTHIAIEIPSKYQAGLDKRYRDYRAGNYELGRSETDQIGLRLAAKLNLEKIYAVDWNDNPPGNQDSDYNWVKFGQTHGFEEALAAISDPARAAQFYVPLGEQSIITWMKQINAPEHLAASHRLYFDIAMIGEGEALIGANWVGTWYARNLKIFNRLVNMTENPDDRILIIYGQGHAYLLNQFALESDRFQLISVDSVLSD